MRLPRSCMPAAISVAVGCLVVVGRRTFVACLLILFTETLKKQAAQQGVEYNRLADAHNAAVSNPYAVIP